MTSKNTPDGVTSLGPTTPVAAQQSDNVREGGHANIRRPRRMPKWLRRGFRLFGGLVAYTLFGISAALVATALLFPDTADAIYGKYQQAERATNQLLVEAGVLEEPVSLDDLGLSTRQDQPNAIGTPGPQAAHVGSSFTADDAGEFLPTIYFGALGNTEVLDSCDGTFTEIESYRASTAVLPVHAAHNGCGGGEILDLSQGDRLRVINPDGTKQVYTVSDLRDVPQVGSTTTDLEGMAGQLTLQTCHWGEPIMRFLALTPAD